MAAAIWKTTDNMWWDGPDDPNAGLLRVKPQTAELWDGPSTKAVAMFEFLKLQISGASSEPRRESQDHRINEMNN